MDLHFTGLPGCNVDSLGFARPRDLNVIAYETFWNKYLAILIRREQRWQKARFLRGKKLKRFIRKGVPSSLRPEIWMLKCLEMDFVIDATRTVDAGVLSMIKIDLPRTYPDNQGISNDVGRRALARILFNVAKFFPDIGYCQGLNYIAGLLYLILNDEAAATRLMVHEVGKRRNYYVQQMSGLQLDIRVLGDLLRERKMTSEELLRLIEADLEILVSKWFLCWYLETLPMEAVLRIWDCLFWEGDPVLFRIAITLIEESKQSIISCANSADILQIFSNIGFTSIANDCHRLLQVAFEKDKDFITDKKLNELRAKYTC